MTDNELKRNALIKKENALLDKYFPELLYQGITASESGKAIPSYIVSLCMIKLGIPPARGHNPT